MQKNVTTKLSEMLFRGEIDVDTTVIIKASEDKKNLKYEVVKNLSERQAHRRDKMPLVETPCDSESDDDVEIIAPNIKKMKGVEIFAPYLKKMKGIAMPSSPEK